MANRLERFKNRLTSSPRFSTFKRTTNSAGIQEQQKTFPDGRNFGEDKNAGSVSLQPFDPTSPVAANFPSSIAGMIHQAVPINPMEDQPTDEADYIESELGSVEAQKNVILHILSQLKLGMDLTKVVLPTFILEKRSLLEMFADYMAHPDLFIRINTAADPETRILVFLEWFLTSFHAGRKDKVAKKPYNPIIGETFHCSWLVPSLPRTSTAEVAPDGSASDPRLSVSDSAEDEIVMTYTAEQVSHHPPITAFRFACPSQQMELSASIHMKSKFQGLSIRAGMVGKVNLRLGAHDDELYQFSLPSAYARSILTIPWIELGDKVNVHCAKTGYSANVVFHTKPLYGNKLHRVSAEVYSPERANNNSKQPTSVGVNATGENAPDNHTSLSENVIARIQGNWNGVLEFERFTKGGRKWLIDVNHLPVCHKRVRPVDQQRPEESRRLWLGVTNALGAGEINLATEMKRELEERQRVSEQYRLHHQFAFPVKYFELKAGTWQFHSPVDSSEPVTSNSSSPTQSNDSQLPHRTSNDRVAVTR